MQSGSPSAFGPPIERDVLGVLAPLAHAYTRRVAPGPIRDAVLPATKEPDRETPDAFTLCAVEEVAVIDPDRRVAWPAAADAIQPGLVKLRPAADAIELSPASPGEPGALHIDRRGRIRLSRSALRATGLAPGDRVVIATLAGTDTRLVVSADRFGVRLAAL